MTELARPHVATEALVLRQSMGLGWRGASGASAIVRGARAIERDVCALCTRQICDSALFGLLFMNTVHEHC